MKTSLVDGLVRMPDDFARAYAESDGPAAVAGYVAGREGDVPGLREALERMIADLRRTGPTRDKDCSRFVMADELERALTAAPARQRAVEGVEHPQTIERFPGPDKQLDRVFIGAGEYVRADEAVRQVTALQRALTEPRREMGEDSLDGNRPLPFDRDTLGRMVREAWVRWAQTQPTPKPSWLVPYDELAEPDKEADRQIGEAIARWTLIGDAGSQSLAAPPPDSDAAPGEARVAEEAKEAGRQAFWKAGALPFSGYGESSYSSRLDAALEAALAVQPAPETLDRGALESAAKYAEGWSLGTVVGKEIARGIRALPSASTTAQSGMMRHMPSRERMREIIAASPDDGECEAGVLHPEAQSGETR